MQRILFLSMSLMIVIAGCEKTVVNPTTIVYSDTTGLQGDRQIRFSLPDGGAAGDSIYYMTDQQVNIYKFNIDYYTGVDSVFYVFEASSGVVDNGTVELYNFTDNVPIAGSLINIVTIPNEAVFFQSGNIYAAFPHKEITLGLRMKGSIPGSGFNANYGKLYLYRK